MYILLGISAFVAWGQPAAARPESMCRHSSRWY